MLQNEGQVAFVTGAGGGIGRAIARKFAALGASVVVADLNLRGAEETVALLPNPTGSQRHAPLQVDVTSKAGTRSIHSSTETGAPVVSATTTFGFTAATLAISSACGPLSARLGRSAGNTSPHPSTSRSRL